ncbi:MAG: UDP-N-acetylmuramoyl-L-alanyl-D-glutamate--2,6-diaminopimelate ligase [Proteobacteria bacterium]|nr:UDP-N-acetylmuramoyl-L-alanyl-D-glutamate--2,6-diaminopimelate ligase [Pseudomonadota bacterium]
MRLSALLSCLPDGLAPTAWVRGAAADDPIIRGVSYDSRAVAPGDLFVALRGAVADGHAYLRQALELGAAALLVEAAPDFELPEGCPAAVVPDTRRALAPVAARFFGEPASSLALVGITGTNGKTSTTYLLESILAKAGHRVGLVGTVEVRFAGERIPAVNTTPESLDLQRMLRAMCTHNVESVVMEVSSHGLELGRVDGCRFAVGAFTNLTQDHLDFHRTMEAYRESKARLFRHHLVPGGTAVINVDDPAGPLLAKSASERGARVLAVSRDAGGNADVRLLESETTLDGSRARIALPSGPLELSLPLLGDFNLENLLVACGVASALGVAPEAIARGVAACPQVPGRVERVGEPDSEAPTVLVDYAHTPDAVEKLLAAVRALTPGRLIAVFGCGGDRDRAKRPLMAEAVARLCDRAVATSDNPRTEDPAAILRDVETGLASLVKAEPAALERTERGYAVVQDRREAIALAVALARAGDTVVIAGKGHEDYQIIGREKLPFDDRVEAERALAERSA